jgi:SHS2 domain-containing protein
LGIDPWTRKARGRPQTLAREMSYRWVEHTAELELEVEAVSEEAIFADALHALAELLGEGARGAGVSREVVVDAGERSVLLVGWLDELVYLAETEDLVPEEVERLELSQRGVRSTVRFLRANPRHVVKGATYHRLRFERSDRGFRATVVLDV